MMDSDDDDIYPTQNDDNDQDDYDPSRINGDDEEEGEEVEEDDEDDSDDEINFITDAKDDNAKADPSSQPKKPPGLGTGAGNDARKPSSTSIPTLSSSTVKGGAEQQSQSQSTADSRRATSQQPPQSQTSNDRSGTEYPARHTSKLDVNANPVHPSIGKPILSTDFDTDFPTDSSKPWRRPGADITDYFNYGFDEFTWASYCLKQQEMPKEIKEINSQAEQMKAFIEGIPGGAGGMPGMPGAPAAPGGSGAAAAAGGPGAGAMPVMPGMPGMPSEAEMQQMFQTVMAQGMDPTQMDPGQFMQMMMGGGGMMGGQPQPGHQPPLGPSAMVQGGFDQPSGYPSGGGGGGGGGGGRGRGRGGRRNWQ